MCSTLGEQDADDPAMGDDEGVRVAGAQAVVPAVQYAGAKLGEGLGTGRGVAHRVRPETRERGGGDLVRGQSFRVAETALAQTPLSLASLTPTSSEPPATLIIVPASRSRTLRRQGFQP